MVAGSDAAKVKEADQQAQASATIKNKKGASDEAKALAEEIEAKHKKLGELDYYELLGIEQTASPGEIMFRSGCFNDAGPILENIVKLGPEEAAYQTGLGWALFKNRPSEPERARKHLEEAISRCDNDAQLFCHFSVVLKKLEETAAANAALARARAIDPRIS